MCLLLKASGGRGPRSRFGTRPGGRIPGPRGGLLPGLEALCALQRLVGPPMSAASNPRALPCGSQPAAREAATPHRSGLAGGLLCLPARLTRSIASAPCGAPEQRALAPRSRALGCVVWVYRVTGQFHRGGCRGIALRPGNWAVGPCWAFLNAPARPQRATAGFLATGGCHEPARWLRLVLPGLPSAGAYVAPRCGSWV